MQIPERDGQQDEARLKALRSYQILDTTAERGFDDITSLAAHVCNTAVALVSLVDRNRQWFKARVGFEPCETNLDSSVCRHALGQTEILEIPDLTLDPRTSTNPLVTGEPHLRFYAGAPLATVEGQVLGTLCVIDHTPRQEGLTDAQRNGLRALAGQVMAQLDLRRALAEREEMMQRRDAEQRVALAEAARLEAMIATQQAVASAKADLATVFQSITDGALRVVDAAEGAVIELRDGDHLVYDTVSGSSFKRKGIRVPIEATLSGKAVLSKRPLYCADTEVDPDMDHALARELGIRSLVAVPVTRRGEPIGALKVHSTRADAFSPRDVVMTQMLAGLVASAFGDVAEVKGRQALKEAENRYRRTFESVTEFGIIVTDLNCIITEWNTGAERIFGWSADEIVGHHANLFFTPEDRQAGRVKVEMRQALRDGQAVDERWHLRKDDTRFYASGNMMPLMDDDGRHLGFIKIVRDRTEQHLAGKALEKSRRELEESEVKWRGLFEQLEEGFILGRVLRGEKGQVVDWVYEEVNRAWGDLVGIPSKQAVGRTIREMFPGIEDAWVKEFADVVETGEAIRFTRQVGLLDRWYDGICQPVGDDRFVVLFMEVTKRVLAERQREALLVLGDRLRESESVSTLSLTASEIVGRALNATRAAFGIVDPDQETVVVQQDWCAPAMPSVAGHHSFRTFGTYIEDLKNGETVIVRDVRHDPRTAGEGAAALEAIGVRTLVNVPILMRGRLAGVAIVHFAEVRDWTNDDTAFLRDTADRTQLAVARAQAEERRTVLNAELAHRLKNMLALVQSIATQTLRTAPDLIQARKALTDRIGAFAKAHDILLVGQRDAGDVRNIVLSAVDPHDPGGRVNLIGPELDIGPKAALTLSLIVHELATNAVKYGALSTDEGHINVEWSVEKAAADGRQELTFEWREVDGPPVTPPTRKSFGTRLIGMGLSGTLGSSSELTYAADGVRCRITASLAELQTTDEPEAV